MFELSTEWYQAHAGTPYLEDTVATYEAMLNDRIGEAVRVYRCDLSGKLVTIHHDEGMLHSVKREEHNTKELIQLRIQLTFEPGNPDFTPLGSARRWDYLYMPDFVKFVVDEDNNPERAAVVAEYKEKKRLERIERNKYNAWLDNELNKIVLARWNGMSWDSLRKNFHQFKRQTYEFTMVTSTPNFRKYTESITSATLARAMCRVFMNEGITLSNIEQRAKHNETAAEYLDRHFKLYHYETRGGDKVYDGHRVVDFIVKQAKGE